MKTTTGNTGSEVLGIRSEELAGYSKEEIREMIDEAKSGILGETFTEEQREQAAELIHKESSKFGTVVFEGEKITLSEQATLSNRVFSGWWGDKRDGEEYFAEYKASGVDSKKNSVAVYWQFLTIKGEEPEDESNYSWENSDITKVVMQ